MTSEEFQQLRNTFERLLAVSGEERTRLLAEISHRDPGLAAEVTRMLAAHAGSTSLLDRPAAGWVIPEATLSTPSRTGMQIGPYRIERELGQGGMGIVYEASRADGSFQKRVAIKILRRDRHGNLFLQRFHRERQILAQLNHPHIAAILDAGETADGNPYFVMEYVDGVPITAYLESRELTVAARLDLFLQIGDAVQHAHRNLTVHRDLKPSNILVTSAGAVKLLDFGIAKLIESEPAEPAEPTAVILTPEYTSPEHIRRQPITTATDVFSLGILLYEILSGQHPFRGQDRLPHEIMQAICEEDPSPPSSVARRDSKILRGELDSIVLTALRKEPAWRYPSVEQLADDVGRYRRGWPVLAKGNGPLYHFEKFVRRQWLPVTAGLLLVASLTAGIVATAHQARLAEISRETAVRERIEAERQKTFAQRAQVDAVEQRGIAETRMKEAEAERLKEQARYRDVRSLASSLLFDLNDGIRDLAGSTTARRLMVTKAQHQLEMLTADGGNDLGLQRDLAAAYERLGELKVDPHRPNQNDAAAALEAYQKAVSLRRKIASTPGAAPADRRDLALSLSKLGDGQFLATNPKLAVESYQDARRLAQVLAQAFPADVSIRRALGTIDERRCVVLLTAGNNQGALEACGEGISILSPLVQAAPEDVELQRRIATTEASYANALRMSGKSEDATKQAKLAVESLRRLEVLAPNNAEYRRLSSSAGTILAASLAASGDLAGSLDAFRRSVRSMEVALEIEPGDLSSALRLAVTLMAFSRRLAAGGDQDGSRDASKEALQLLESTSTAPGAGPVEWNEYADALLKVDADLRQPARALQLAQSAVASTNRKNPFFMDTLAWAYYRTGNRSKAAETEREALGLLPSDAKGGLHDELDRGLHTFLGDGKEF